LDNEAKNSEGY
jgi:hypothetical protein